MRKIMIVLFIATIFLMSDSITYAKTINEADTPLCDTVKYALIISLSQPIDEAIKEIYKNDKNAPEGLTWAAYGAEIVKIKQTSPGLGGMYEITVRVMPYYGAHNSYGIDEVVVTARGELISYRHIKTYPRFF